MQGTIKPIITLKNEPANDIIKLKDCETLAINITISTIIILNIDLLYLTY